MPMMAATAAMLFAVGFAGGYFLRAALSWFRRSRLRKQRTVRETEALLKQTVAVAQGATPAMKDAPSIGSTANA